VRLFLLCLDRSPVQIGCAFFQSNFYLVVYKDMSASGMEQASIPGAQATRDPKALGPQEIEDKIRRLRNNGLYALPVSVFWHQNSGSKQADFPRKYAHVKDPEAWERSFDSMMKEKRDATRLAILTGVSGVYVVDIDIAAKGEKQPGIDLWQQLVRIHGEPDTLKAKSNSGHLMHIRTKRFVTNDESEGVEELHVSFLKESSGGGELDARELFCKPQSYVPQYKLCLFTNYMPHFPGDDTALLRRMVLISFNFVFKSPDELDETNKWHKPIDVGLKYYSESDEGAADTLDFCVQGAI
jgi:hypothetical protein